MLWSKCLALVPMIALVHGRYANRPVRDSSAVIFGQRRSDDRNNNNDRDTDAINFEEYQYEYDNGGENRDDEDIRHQQQQLSTTSPESLIRIAGGEAATHVVGFGSIGSSDGVRPSFNPRRFRSSTTQPDRNRQREQRQQQHREEQQQQQEEQEQQRHLPLQRRVICLQWRIVRRRLRCVKKQVVFV